MNQHDKQLHDEAYALIEKSNRTAHEDNRLKELLLEINRDHGFQRGQTSQHTQSYNQSNTGQTHKVAPTPEQKAAKINEFLDMIKDKPSDRYDNRQPFKKINSRYGAEEIS
jgi:hypothetical protein